jgi:hypothetical protein
MNEPRKDLNRPGAHRCGASPPPLASSYTTARWDARVLGEGAEYLLKRALVDHRIAMPRHDSQQDILLTRKIDLPAR